MIHKLEYTQMIENLIKIVKTRNISISIDINGMVRVYQKNTKYPTPIYVNGSTALTFDNVMPFSSVLRVISNSKMKITDDDGRLKEVDILSVSIDYVNDKLVLLAADYDNQSCVLTGKTQSYSNLEEWETLLETY